MRRLVTILCQHVLQRRLIKRLYNRLDIILILQRRRMRRLYDHAWILFISLSPIRGVLASPWRGSRKMHQQLQL